MSNSIKRRSFGRGKEPVLEVGFKNYVLCDRIVAIQDVSSLPVRRMRDRALQSNLLVDASAGRKEKSVVIMDSGHVVISSIASQTLAERLINVTIYSALAEQEIEEGEFVS